MWSWNSSPLYAINKRIINIYIKIRSHPVRYWYLNLHPRMYFFEIIAVTILKQKQTVFVAPAFWLWYSRELMSTKSRCFCEIVGSKNLHRICPTKCILSYSIQSLNSGRQVASQNERLNEFFVSICSWVFFSCRAWFASTSCPRSVTACFFAFFFFVSFVKARLT